MGPTTDRHLYQVPRYRAADGTWTEDFAAAAARSGAGLQWDTGAITSLLSLSWVSGDRTLVSQVRRQPWLSSLDARGEPVLHPIPLHGRRLVSPAEAARELARLTTDELVRACEGRREVVLLLSGGLDSRIVAGLVTAAVRQGRITATVRALTWGLPDSRDVVYARALAQALDVELIHADLQPRHLLENIDAAADLLGATVSGAHLHRMLAVADLPRDTLVLAGSYGDSIGRAEFSGRHLLEAIPPRPVERFRLLTRSAWQEGARQMAADCRALRSRAPGAPPYAQREHEQQGIYMRNLIGHAMTVINRHATLYQAFTAPEVFGYMWSLHPSMRTDAIYANIFESFGPALARLPWARTNRALRGATSGAREDLSRAYHQYREWTCGPLFEAIRERIDRPLLQDAGIFDLQAVDALDARVRAGTADNHECENFIWLASLGRLAARLRSAGGSLAPAEPGPPEVLSASPDVAAAARPRLRQRVRSLPLMPDLLDMRKPLRRAWLRTTALLRYPPKAPPRAAVAATAAPPPRILFATGEPIPVGMANTNRILSYCRGFVEQGARVTILVLKPTEVHGRPPVNTAPAGVYEGIEFRYAGGTTQRSNSFGGRRAQDFAALAKGCALVARYHRETPASALLIAGANAPRFISSLFLVTRALRIPFVQERSEYPIHVLKYQSLPGRLYARAYVALAYKAFDAMLVMTGPLEEYFTSRVRRGVPLLRVPMTVEPDRFLATDRPRPTPDPYVAYCGQLGGTKDGVPILLEAFARVAGRIPRVKLYVLGDDPDPEVLPALRTRVEQLGVGDRVVFTGRIPRDEMPGYLCHAAALALARPTSLQAEGGFPTKLGEYLATGNPVVVTAVGEIPAFLTDGVNAYVSAPDSAEAFATKLEQALTDGDRARRIGRAGRDVVMAHFDYRAQAARTLQFLQELARRRR